ncbi:hypothetical protein B0H11DRAFT_2072117 [Mycena galericulata]|nr:hypothetical protein B0H11DRAFT_2072117 [Mycena galericulata]
MVEYTPLMSIPPEDDEYGDIEPKESHQKTHSTRYLLPITVLMALLASFAAAAFHLSMLSDSQPLLAPKEIASNLRMVKPTPNLEKGRETMVEMNLKYPDMVFPKYMTRVNSAAPDTVYDSGSSIVLSPTDSMIYHWRAKSSWPMCYITAWVSPADDLIAGHKSYTSEGDVTSIQIWNLSTPDNPKTLKTLSWSSRPPRESLLGTVNFTGLDIQRSDSDLDGQELRAPTPRFSCLGIKEITVEVACTGCHLEFYQIFSDPALGFELMQLG